MTDAPPVRARRSEPTLGALLHPAPHLVLQEHKLRPPEHRRALVARPWLAERLAAGVDLGIVTAPAGYGKTTLLGEVLASDDRATAWLTLDVADNDPVLLLTYLVLVLDRLEPMDPALLAQLWRPAPAIVTRVLPQLVHALEQRTVPFVLALDDVHVLVAQEAVDVVAVLAAGIPDGSLLVVGGRSSPPLSLGSLRLQRRVAELGPDDLALDVAAASILSISLGLQLGDDDLATMVAGTEGWPAAVYLVALSLQAGDRDVLGDLAGGRLVADYLRDELLEGLGGDEAAFLLRASCLPRLSGQLCDCVLDRTGSAELLEDLARRNLLVSALDHRREWYRLHPLLADLLQAELTNRTPGEVVAVHRRASAWFEARGGVDDAIDHAVSASDHARVEGLLIANYAMFVSTGRHATVQRWLASFSPDQLVERPLLAVLMGFASLPAGDGAGARHWLDVAEAGLGATFVAESEGPPAEALVALLRATLLEVPAARMLDDAQHAHALLAFGDWHAYACLLVGTASYLLGDDVDAESALLEGIAEAASRAANVHALLLAQLALVRAEQGRWDVATELARAGRRLLAENGLEDVPSLLLVTAASCLVEARAGDAAAAEPDRVLTARHLVSFERVAPWVNLSARVALARAGVLLGNRVAARTMVDELDRYIDRVPDAARVKDQAAEIRRSLRTGQDGPGWGPSALTTAELRVLEYLPTHLSLVEIAERLHLSRNTVKTHAIAIYRKLGCSSRSGAIVAATDAGLLSELVRP